MTTMVNQLSIVEFQELVERIIERKLIELLGDPDEGLEIRERVRARLLRQRKAVAAGERGESLEDVIRELGLE
jgi:hypothetical protein